MGIIESILYPFIFILSFLFEIILSQLAEYPILAISLFALIISLLLRPIQQRRRNASLQQLYNKGNSVGMGVVGRVITPTQ
jgi:Na+/H+-dicarboxylate symporter